MQIKNGVHMVACGILPRDSEFKVVGAKDTPLCKFSVKVDEKPDTKEAIWQNCIVWFEKANYAALFKKGDTVWVSGKIETRTYTKRDGEQGTSSELNVEFAMKMPSGFAISTEPDYGGLPD